MKLRGNNVKPRPAIILPAVESNAATKGQETHTLFKGYVGAKGFLTKKGFKGMKLNHTWAKHLLESFRTDDVELFDIACESPMCDLEQRVEGGDNGAPMSIAMQGIYGGNQFDTQVDVLMNTERGHIARAGIFISAYEWTIMDSNLNKLGHFSSARFSTVFRGDTWAVLAVLDNAFLIANALVAKGVDAMLENSDGKDLFDAVKRQYAEVTIVLRDIRLEKEQMAKQLVLPTAAKAVEDREMAVIVTLTNMLSFCSSLKRYYAKRLSMIDLERVELRRADRSGLPVDPWRRWNASLREKVATRIHECDELRGYIKEKLKLTHKKNQDARNNLDYTRAMLLEARKIKEQEDDEANGDDDDNSDEDHTVDNDTLQDPNGTSPSFKIRRRKMSQASDTMSVHSMAPSETEDVMPVLTTQISNMQLQKRKTSTVSVVSVQSNATARSNLSWTEQILHKEGLGKSGKSQLELAADKEKVSGFAPVLGVLNQTDDEIVMYK